MYEYAVTHYDASTGEGGLFVEYIDTFLKLKAEASGFVHPPMRTDTSKSLGKARQSCSIKTRSDITPPNEHSPNCLNSMWGKFGENPRKTQTVNFRGAGIV